MGIAGLLGLMLNFGYFDLVVRCGFVLLCRLIWLPYARVGFCGLVPFTVGVCCDC